MKGYHLLKVSAVERLTPDAVKISFEIPERLRPAFQFLPGQYITIKKNLDGKEVRRSYSLCSLPSDGEFSVGIKKMDGGVFSTYANEQLIAGEQMEVHTPEGRFLYDAGTDSARVIWGIAAGSGITPVMSIMKKVLQSTNHQFVLIYGNRSVEQTMFFREIKGLMDAYPQRLKVKFIFSRTEEQEALFGRIEQSTLNFLLKNEFNGLQPDKAYLCGPSGMIDAARQTLTNAGVDEGNVWSELFTSDEVPEIEGSGNVPEGKTKLRVIIDEVEHELVMDRKQRVLDAVLAQHIDAPYSCQGGICSSCIARVTSGKASMVKNQILTDSEVADGLILTCQSLAETAELSIDYDDV